MPDVTFRHGNPTNIDYTPGANRNAGDVVLVGNTTGLTCAIVVKDAANAALSAAAVGGVWQAVNLNNAANGAKVWWDNSAKKITTTSTNNAQFGYICSRGGGGANSVCDVMHHPFV